MKFPNIPKTLLAGILLSISFSPLMAQSQMHERPEGHEESEGCPRPFHHHHHHIPLDEYTPIVDYSHYSEADMSEALTQLEETFEDALDKLEAHKREGRNLRDQINDTIEKINLSHDVVAKKTLEDELSALMDHREVHRKEKRIFHDERMMLRLEMRYLNELRNSKIKTLSI